MDNEEEKESRDIVWANSPSKACFGMTPIQAFEMCAEAFVRMKQKKGIEDEKAEKAKTQGRRALVEHTKRKDSE